MQDLSSDQGGIAFLKYKASVSKSHSKNNNNLTFSPYMNEKQNSKSLNLGKG